MHEHEAEATAQRRVPCGARIEGKKEENSKEVQFDWPKEANTPLHTNPRPAASARIPAIILAYTMARDPTQTSAEIKTELDELAARLRKHDPILYPAIYKQALKCQVRCVWRRISGK